MQTYSRDLRERIVAARQQGHSAQEIARLFGVSKRSVERFWQKYLATGGVEPKQRGGYRRSRLEKHDRKLRRWIKEKADLTFGSASGTHRPRPRHQAGHDRLVAPLGTPGSEL